MMIKKFCLAALMMTWAISTGCATTTKPTVMTLSDKEAFLGIYAPQEEVSVRRLPESFDEGSTASWWLGQMKSRWPLLLENFTWQNGQLRLIRPAAEALRIRRDAESDSTSLLTRKEWAVDVLQTSESDLWARLREKASTVRLKQRGQRPGGRPRECWPQSSDYLTGAAIRWAEVPSDDCCRQIDREQAEAESSKKERRRR